MKTSYLIGILLIFNSSFALAQVQNTNQIIDASNEKLRNLVGVDLFRFYTLGNASQYQILKRNGKNKWKRLKTNKILKSDFLEAQVQFNFNHPDFNYSTLKTTYIKLDKNLNLTNKPFIQFIPEFIKKTN